MAENTLRALLAGGEPTIGTPILAPWPGLIEVMGGSPAVYHVEFLAEYAPHDLLDLEHPARAADLAGLDMMAKVDGPNRT